MENGDFGALKRRAQPSAAWLAGPPATRGRACGAQRAPGVMRAAAFSVR